VDDALATAVAVLADRDATADIIREATASLRRALDQLVVADRAPPKVMVSLSGNDNATGILRGPVVATASATDDGSEPVTVEYRVNGAESWQVYTEPLRFERAGEYVLEVRGTDGAGNVSEVEEVTFSRPALGAGRVVHGAV